jgi:hypothetical protein
MEKTCSGQLEWLLPLVVGKKPSFSDVPVSVMVETAAEYPKLFETELDLKSFMGCADYYSTKDLLGGAVRDALPRFETVGDLVYCALKLGVVSEIPDCGHSVLGRAFYPWNKQGLKECASKAFVGIVSSVQPNVPGFGPMVVIVCPIVPEASWISDEKQPTVYDVAAYNAYTNFVSLINGKRENLLSLFPEECSEPAQKNDEPFFVSLSGTIPTVSKKEKSKEEGKNRAPPVKSAPQTREPPPVKYPGKGERPQPKRPEKGLVPDRPQKGSRSGGKGKGNAKPSAAYQPMAYSSRPRPKTYEKAVIKKQSVFSRPPPPPKGSSEW